VVLAQTFRRLAAEIGAPIGDTMRRAQLEVWPEWFRPPAPSDPPHSRTCGFVFDDVDASQSLSPKAGASAVVASFGSAASLHAIDRHLAVAGASGRLGRRCLLIGPSADVAAPSPNIMVVPSAPYASVFPAASVVVHHGGFGTCGEALRAGKPSLVTPFAFDQFDTAARVQDLGLGHWFAGEANRIALITASLDPLCATVGRSRAHDAALKIAAAPDGADRAAELIETL